MAEEHIAYVVDSTHPINTAMVCLKWNGKTAEAPKHQGNMC